MINDLHELKVKDYKRVVLKQNEEDLGRIKEDSVDREKNRETLSSCIDILDTSKHPESGNVKTFSSCVIDDASVNV